MNKLVTAVLSLIMSVTILGLHKNAAAIDSVTASNKIRVQGVVLPSICVVIDQDGNILRIASNTSEDITPRVFVDDLVAGSEVPLTEDVYLHYREIVPSGSVKPGTLYLRPATTTTTYSIINQTSLRALITRH